ncbi:MAG: sensor histidine kinase [Conexibacteraceae bacterium]|nr:sensor histidine kinase [Conexibacteraceae bacterium]
MRPLRALRERSDRWSLQWKVFALNATVFALAFAAVAWTPVTVHRVARPGEVLVLSGVLVLMLVLDLFLLRRAFGPLKRLASTMGAVDSVLEDDQRRSFDGASSEVRALAEALDRMLERLEQERRGGALRELAAQERERRRIAGELHDEVGQMLTAIALRAERAAQEAEGDQRAALLEISESALGGLEDVRQIARQLRPEVLDDLGLVNAVIALCGRVDRQGIRVRRELDWTLPELAPEVELVIYRVAQEALTNVLRHADATEVVVGLHSAGRRVLLEVTDNGRGLPAGAVEQGMRGMRERAVVINANLEVRPGTEGGTCLVLGVPV